MFSKLVSLSLLAISAAVASAREQVTLPAGYYTIHSDYANGFVHSNGGDINPLTIVPESGAQETWYIQPVGGTGHIFNNKATHSYAYAATPGETGDPVFSHVNLQTTWHIYKAGGDMYYISDRPTRDLLDWTATDDSDPRIITLEPPQPDNSDAAQKWHILPVNVN
ncbi:hypothetical protein NP233_g7948 [Leucocoprinus birnbaumii]|uniref:Ricin B lectin domain-containing protein n=1 Tax=Leucocoprinus birnbaumii TaxID=56174 RepID=A0AAD5VTQ8_9AGAR|nr:hypothetical protein NP233_g7948 [Leucocoprinus birnbaumii]